MKVKDLKKKLENADDQAYIATAGADHHFKGIELADMTVGLVDKFGEIYQDDEQERVPSDRYIQRVKLFLLD